MKIIVSQEIEMVCPLFVGAAVEAQVSMKERQLDLNSRNTREDTIRLQRLREEEYIRKKARRGTRLRTLIAVPVALGLAAAALFWGSPWLRRRWSACSWARRT